VRGDRACERALSWVALWSIVERLLTRSKGTRPHLRGDNAGTLLAYVPIRPNCYGGTVFNNPIDAVLPTTQPKRQRRKCAAKLHVARHCDVPAAVEGSRGAALWSRPLANAPTARSTTTQWWRIRWSGSPRCRRSENMHVAFDSLGCRLTGFKTLA
jgi:hypothetical protein